MKLTPEYSSPSITYKASTTNSPSIQKKIMKYHRRIRRQISKLSKEGRLSKKSSLNLKKRFTTGKSRNYNASNKEKENGEQLRFQVAKTMIRRLSFSETDSKDFIKKLRTEDFGIAGTGNAFAFDESDSSIQVSECDENFISNQFAESASSHFKPIQSEISQKNHLTMKWKVNDNLVKKVIKRARSWDLVVQVLDARDPQKTKFSGLKALLEKQGFKGQMCLIINKADLVPDQIVQQWKKKMMKEDKVFISKINKNNKSSVKIITENDENNNDHSKFMQYLENVKLNTLKNTQKSKVKIGFLGLPNSGKSSIINRLFGRKVCGVSPKPGHTRAIIEKYLFQDFIVTDSPGIFDDNFSTMFETSKNLGNPMKEVSNPFEITDLNSSSCKRISSYVANEARDRPKLSREATLVLQNALSLEYLPDIMEPINFILSSVGEKYLKSFYQIESFESTEDFLRKIALQQNIFSMNGEIDILLIARMIICQWNRGKISHFTYPN